MEFFDVYVLKEQWKDGAIPHYPSVRIVLGEYFPYEGQAVISHDLTSDQEIDWAIEDLHRALEDARKKAKAKLKRIEAKVQKLKGQGSAPQ